MKKKKGIQVGGYLLNNKTYFEPLIIDNLKLVIETTILDKNLIIKMINKLNSVAFTINTKVLDFIIENNDKYHLITVSDHIYSKKSKLTLVEKRELISFNSQKYLALNILSIANIFRNVSEFYIPVRLDYRGRIYTSTEFLTYQGNELSKSLLLFKKESIIELTDKDAGCYKLP